MNQPNGIPFPERRRFTYVQVILASLVVGSGILCLLGWVMGRPDISALWAGKIPMAPSTALLFVLFGIALFLRVGPTIQMLRVKIATGIVAISAAISSLLLVTSIAGVYLSVEHLGFKITDAAGIIPPGHMSPVTAIFFLWAGISFLMIAPNRLSIQLLSKAAWFMASLLTVISSVLFIAYILGQPLFYGGAFIPPAATTVFAFACLGLALMLIARPHTSWFTARAENKGRFPIPFLLVFILLASGIFTAGYIGYKQYEQSYRLHIEHELSAIAELKSNDLVRWRQERLADGNILFKNLAFSELVNRIIEKPDDRQTLQRIESWFSRYGAHRYNSICLHNIQGEIILSYPENSHPLSQHVRQILPEIMLSDSVILDDFFLDDSDENTTYLALYVPVYKGIDDNNQPVGLVVILINPQMYINPHIQTWPTPSRTAETLLLRREGDEVVFLNQLRFADNTALKLRFPITQTDLPAVMAALGETGIVEGFDYRKEEVIADARPIPGSPWFLITKIDKQEILAPLRERIWLMVAAVLILLVASGFAVGFFYRKKQTGFLEKQLEAEIAVKASEIRYRRLFESAKDGILILDAETGMIVDVNPFLLGMLGYSYEQFLGKKVWELGFLKDIIANKDKFIELQQKEYVRYEDLPLETADGQLKHVEFVSNVYEVNHSKVIQCNIRDITERKHAEAEFKELFIRTEAILASVPDIIMEVDNEKIYKWTNKAGYEFFGEDVLGKEAAYYFEGEQETYKIVQPLFGGLEDLFYVESWQRRKDGEKRLLAWWCKVVKNIDGEVTGAVSSARDITDQIRAEETRKNLEMHMRQQQKLESIGTLASGVAHEINNPINGIMNYARLIEDRLSEDSPLKEFAVEIGKETNRVSTIVRNLLTFSRNEKETHSPTDIEEIINDTLSLVQSIIRNDQITLELDIPSDLPKILCRSQQIQQVLMNLVTNARDALNERYPEHDEDKKLIIMVRPFEKDNVKWIRMTVEDHGIGIPEEHCRRILDPFYSTKDRTKGTGLGLSISYGIIKEHLGELHFETEPEQYTRFHVDLRVNNGWTLEGSHEEEIK